MSTDHKYEYFLWKGQETAQAVEEEGAAEGEGAGDEDGEEEGEGEKATQGYEGNKQDGMLRKGKQSLFSIMWVGQCPLLWEGEISSETWKIKN